MRTDNQGWGNATGSTGPLPHGELREDLFGRNNLISEHDICDLHMVRSDPSQRGRLAKLSAILGWQIRTTAHWSPWQRLRDIYGWDILLTACDRCEEQRFPQTVERLCRAEKKSREESKKIAESMEKVEKSRTEEAQKAEANRLFQEKYKDQLAGLSGLAYFTKLTELRKKEQC